MWWYGDFAARLSVWVGVCCDFGNFDLFGLIYLWFLFLGGLVIWFCFGLLGFELFAFWFALVVCVICWFSISAERLVVWASAGVLLAWCFGVVCLWWFPGFSGFGFDLFSVWLVVVWCLGSLCLVFQFDFLCFFECGRLCWLLVNLFYGLCWLTLFWFLFFGFVFDSDCLGFAYWFVFGSLWFRYLGAW